MILKSITAYLLGWNYLEFRATFQRENDEDQAMSVRRIAQRGFDVLHSYFGDLRNDGKDKYKQLETKGLGDLIQRIGSPDCLEDLMDTRIDKILPNKLVNDLARVILNIMVHNGTLPEEDLDMKHLVQLMESQQLGVPTLRGYMDMMVRAITKASGYAYRPILLQTSKRKRPK